MGVLVHTNFLKNEIRFSLDPLSEYLAALYFIDSFRGNEASWKTLLKCIHQLSERETTIEGFRIALYDCALHNRRQIPCCILSIALELHYLIDFSPFFKKAANLLLGTGASENLAQNAILNAIFK